MHTQICAAVPGVPVLADADTGGGSVLAVQHCVRQLIAAGAKGMIIEDQVWPKRTGSQRKEVSGNSGRLWARWDYWGGGAGLTSQ